MEELPILPARMQVELLDRKTWKTRVELTTATDSLLTLTGAGFYFAPYIPAAICIRTGAVPQ